MGARTRALGLALLSLLLPGGARADVVHLTNGRTVSGTVVAEDERGVTVRTPDGKLTLPRGLVERIERQGRGETLLALARERIQAGAHEEAARLLEQAAQDEDPAVAERARQELELLEARLERARAHRPPPSTPVTLPPEAAGKPQEGQSLQEQFDRGRKALEDGDLERARRLLEPLALGNPQQPVLRYLYGRVLERQGDEPRARREYEAALGQRAPEERRPVAWLGELARRATAGEELGPDSPGVGPEWRREAGEHFSIYHPFAQVEPWLVEEPEQALRDVMDRLAIKVHELRPGGAIQVFLFPTQEDYREADGPALSGGHCRRRPAPDGWLVEIRAFPQRAFYRTTLRHEVGHALVFQIAPDLPTWASEGAAVWAEPPATRLSYRAVCQGLLAEGALPDLEQVLRGGLPRGEDWQAVRRFYAVCSGAFETLVGLCDGSPRKALQVARRIARDGPAVGLGEVRVTVRGFQRAFADAVSRSGE